VAKWDDMVSKKDEVSNTVFLAELLFIFSTEKNMLDIEYIENILKGKDGLEFQKCGANYLRKKYGGAFQEVSSMGPLGDGGKDGYVLETREYFAMSTWSDNIATKIKNDYKNCIDKNLEVKKFIFVTNRKIGPKECDVIDKLNLGNHDIKIETLSHRDMAKALIEYPQREVLAILGKPVSFYDEKTVYFEECMDRQLTFTLWESIKDSMHVYLATVFFVVVFCTSFFYVKAEWAKTLCFIVVAALMCLYMLLNINSLRKYKYAHKILYLMVTGKLQPQNEVLLNEGRHLTIKRNSTWNFTINKRSINCIKRGCSSKVFLYTQEDGTMIGRCEKDKLNHTYRVDNNFYGELL